MKVLQVNVVYGKGSTGKITQDLHYELLARGHESVVCYGRGQESDDARVIKTCGEVYSKANNAISRISGIMYGGCFFSTKRLIDEIKKQKPDLVHLQCINGYFVNIYRLITWLRENRIKTVVTLHAEFMFTGGCGYAVDCEKWRDPESPCAGGCPRRYQETRSLVFDRTAEMTHRMKAAFDGFDEGLIITSVSPWLMERAKQSAVFKDKTHRVVMNGLNENVFYPRKTNLLREKYGIDNEIIFHATPSFTDDTSDIKGGYHLIEIARRLPEYTFIVAGNYSVKSKLPENIILLGRISDQNELASYYSESDLTLLVSSRETFSMVTAESLCCGTPVVGFKAGGPESIAIKEYCSFVEYGDMDALTAALRSMLSKNTIIDQNKCRRVYSSETMAEAYIDCYKAVVNDDK